MAGNQGFAGFARPTAVGALVRLAARTPASGDASATFSNIPGKFDALLLLGTVRGTTVGGDLTDRLTAQFNGDSGSNYAWSQFGGDGSSPFLDGAAGVGVMHLGDVVMGAAGAGQATSIEIKFPFYAGTVLQKQVFSTTSLLPDNTSPTQVELFGGSWSGTAAITSITLALAAGNFDSGTSFVLYGIGG